jgi:hypothetical protein
VKKEKARRVLEEETKVEYEVKMKKTLERRKELLLKVM